MKENSPLIHWWVAEIKKPGKSPQGRLKFAYILFLITVFVSFRLLVYRQAD
jgi:hypothetical protein